jgi:hypothetical protein
MKLETKHNVWGITLVVGVFALLVPATNLQSWWLGSLGIAWFIIMGALQFKIFRCPKCGELAFKTRRGIYVPWVGSACKFCGAEY